MYEESAEFYDAIYSFKDYKHEAAQIHEYISNLHPHADSVLDVACGTGNHISFLKDHYAVDGIDLNEDFIKAARRRNVTSRFWVADMTSFQLNKKYDVVMCLFSSIAYVRTLDLVRRAASQFVNHLNDRGFIIIEPWFTPDAWKPGIVTVINSEFEDMKICRMSHSDRDGDISILNFEYLVGSSNGIRHFKERHELGLFAQDEMLDVFESTGMSVQYDPEGITGRGLYILR